MLVHLSQLLLSQAGEQSKYRCQREMEMPKTGLTLDPDGQDLISPTTTPPSYFQPSSQESQEFCLPGNILLVNIYVFADSWFVSG